MNTKNIHSVIRRCTISSTLLLTGMLALALALMLWQRHYPIASGVHLPISLKLLFEPLVWAAVIVAATVVSQVRRYRRVNAPPKPSPQSEPDAERTALLVQAIQLDLQDLSQAAGLQTTPQVALTTGDPRLAYMTQGQSKGRPTSIYLSRQLINLRPSRQEVRGILAHELGHRLLNTSIWRDQVMGTIQAVILALLAVPALKTALLAGDAIMPLTSFAVACGGAVLVLLAALLLVGVSFKLCAAILSRLHERGSDDISRELVAPGILASLLIKRERHLIKHGFRSHGQVSFSVKGLRNLMRLVLSSHPTLFQRIQRNRRSLS